MCLVERDVVGQQAGDFHPGQSYPPRLRAILAVVSVTKLHSWLHFFKIFFIIHI